MLKPFEVRFSPKLHVHVSAAHTPPVPVAQGKETEHNWAGREQAIQRVRGMLKGEVHERFTDTFLHGLKHGFMDASLKTVRIVPP